MKRSIAYDMGTYETEKLDEKKQEKKLIEIERK